MKGFWFWWCTVFTLAVSVEASWDDARLEAALIKLRGRDGCCPQRPGFDDPAAWR